MIKRAKTVRPRRKDRQGHIPLSKSHRKYSAWLALGMMEEEKSSEE